MRLCAYLLLCSTLCRGVATSMTLFRWITIASVFAYTCSWDQMDPVYGPVVHVSVLFRHGLRTPKGTYPNDPHQDWVWTRGIGELTKEGVQQHYILGSWLRQRYAHLLPHDGNYNASAIRVLSSDTDRCIMSAEANMAGMFPITRDEFWGGINWFPVPVHAIPKKRDNMMAFSRRCNNYQKAKAAFRKSLAYRRILRKYRRVLDYASNCTGWKVNPQRMVRTYDNLFIQSLYGLRLPNWTHNFFPDSKDLNELVGIQFALPTWTDDMKRFRAGALLNRMLENMTGKLNGTTLENISVFSAHDTTVSALLNTIGVFDFVHPPFAAAVLVELRVPPVGLPVVTIFYKKSLDPRIEPVSLCLPMCDCPCPLRLAEKLWEKYLVRDWDKECDNNN